MLKSYKWMGWDGMGWKSLKALILRAPLCGANNCFVNYVSCIICKSCFSCIDAVEAIPSDCCDTVGQ